MVEVENANARRARESGAAAHDGCLCGAESGLLFAHKGCRKGLASDFDVRHSGRGDCPGTLKEGMGRSISRSVERRASSIDSAGGEALASAAGDFCTCEGKWPQGYRRDSQMTGRVLCVARHG